MLSCWKVKFLSSIFIVVANLFNKLFVQVINTLPFNFLFTNFTSVAPWSNTVPNRVSTSSQLSTVQHFFFFSENKPPIKIIFLLIRENDFSPMNVAISKLQIVLYLTISIVVFSLISVVSSLFYNTLCALTPANSVICLAVDDKFETFLKMARRSREFIALDQPWILFIFYITFKIL